MAERPILILTVDLDSYIFEQTLSGWERGSGGRTNVVVGQSDKCCGRTVGHMSVGLTSVGQKSRHQYDSNKRSFQILFG
jgi:hypothetical protein